MKDNILCIFIMLFVSVTFNANAQKRPQGQFSVKGVLVDSLSNEGEPYGSVVILGGLIFVNFPLCIHLC